MSGRKILIINIIFIESDWINGVKIADSPSSPIVIGDDEIPTEFSSHSPLYQSQSHDQSSYLTNMTENSTPISLTDAAESMNIDQIVIIRYRDRKISDGVRQKRKQKKEFSNNLYLKKARERVQGITKIEKQIERAKNTNKQTKIRAV